MVLGAAMWAAGSQVILSPSSVPGTVVWSGGPRAMGWGQVGTGRAAPSTLRSSGEKATLLSNEPGSQPCSPQALQVKILCAHWLQIMFS